MIRQTIIRSTKSALRTTMQAPRTLSTTAARAAEGDAGAPRSGGSAQGYAHSSCTRQTIQHASR